MATRQQSPGRSAIRSRCSPHELLTVSIPSGEARLMTHDISDYSNDLGITRDGQTIAATTVVVNLNVWIAPAANPTYGQQITHSRNPTFELRRRLSMASC